MKKIYYTCYQTTNLINDIIYKGVHETKKINDSYLGSGKLLGRAIRFYGRENFRKDILEVYDTKEDMDAWERREVTQEFVNRKDTYNLIPGGINMCSLTGEANGFYGKHHTNETKELVRNTKKKRMDEYGFMYETTPVLIEGIRYGGTTHARNALKISYYVLKAKLANPAFPNWFYEDHKLNDEAAEWWKGEVIRRQNIKEKKREGCRIRMTGRIMSEEEKKKRSDSKKGKPSPWMIIANKNPEKIRKTAEKHRGMKRSEIARKNMSDAAKLRPAQNKGARTCHDPINRIRKYIKSGNPLPEGFFWGGLSKKHEQEKLRTS